MIRSHMKLKAAGICCVAAMTLVAFGQNPVQPQYQTAGPYNAQSAPPAGQQQPLLSPDQLDNLVAPIALYPDDLLSEVLAASTYPLEVVEAWQWMQANPNLKGQALIDAAKQQDWDPSVQGLVAFPDVLQQMNRDVRWTTDLGNAFLAQQADVMSAVQSMRARAEQAGKLRSTAQENVNTVYQDGQSAITIAPTDPQVVYVPEYDPVYIWGPPVYGYYPYLWYPPVYVGIGWGPGIFLGSYFGGFVGFGGWGWGCNWFGGGLFLNAGFFTHYGFRGYGGWDRDFRGRVGWQHDPGHRMGVAYANRGVSQRFAGGSRPSFARSEARSGFGPQRQAARSNFSDGGNQGGRTFGGSNAGARAPQPQGGRSFSNAPRNSGSVAGNAFRGGNANSGQRFSSAPRAPQQNSRSFSNGGNSAQGRSFPAAPRAQQNGSRGFSGSPAQRSFGGSSAPAAPASRGFSAPNRGSSSPAPSRNFSAPAPNRNFSAPAPNRGFSSPAPSRSFSAPAPNRNFSAPAPNRSFSAPAPNRSFSAPAPSRSFSAPSRSFSAPRSSGGGGFSAPRSSGGGGGFRGGGGGGGSHGGGGGGGSHGGRR